MSKPRPILLTITWWNNIFYIPCLSRTKSHSKNWQLSLTVAIWRRWSREPITTSSGPSMFLFRVIRMDYHAGRNFIPHQQQRSLDWNSLFSILVDPWFLVISKTTREWLRSIFEKDIGWNTLYAFKCRFSRLYDAPLTGFSEEMPTKCVAIERRNRIMNRYGCLLHSQSRA